MIYPVDFESKIGFDEVKGRLTTYCMSSLGRELVDNLAFSDNILHIRTKLEQVNEVHRLLQENEQFPLQHFFDMREAVSRLKAEGAYLNEKELFDLRRSMDTIAHMVFFLNKKVDNSHSGRIYDTDFYDGVIFHDDVCEADTEPVSFSNYQAYNDGTKEVVGHHDTKKGDDGQRYDDYILYGIPLARNNSDDGHTCKSRRADHVVASFHKFPLPEMTSGDEQEDIGGDNPPKDDSASTYLYPNLQRLTVQIRTFPELVRAIDRIIDDGGRMRDDASLLLAQLRKDLFQAESSVSRTLHNILLAAQRDGLVEKDATPTLRDGRLVIPVAPAQKRKMKGIVHDESASGKTIFIEPAEVVETNNRIRELEMDIRREIIRILKEISGTLRPFVTDIVSSYRLPAVIDFIQAKLKFADSIGAIIPQVVKSPLIDWVEAVHPLLKLSLEKQGKEVVPLDIALRENKRILIISGPNAGGKSVCLKTVGLLQYMIQCGLPVTLSEHSKVGIFRHIMIDIGDEQSIENDLSTYSSHLLNMKHMIRRADPGALLLIDEFGNGTEPMIGGAIAEAVLKQFCQKGAFGIITTHYQNLKHFADSHPMIENGAMLYDRHQMQALFKLEIGRPGSSFAIEIARKTGLPEAVIQDASSLVGSEYIMSDKYLQDIVRDKRYWEAKRDNIHRREKDLEKRIARFESQVEDLQNKRKEILAKAREQAEELMKESNRRIENVIKEIKEKQAEKEETKRIREELHTFRNEVLNGEDNKNDKLIEAKMRQIERRRQRKEQKKAEILKAGESALRPSETPPTAKAVHESPLAVGCSVRIKGLPSVGVIDSLTGEHAFVIFGDVRTKIKPDKLERCMPSRTSSSGTHATVSRTTHEAIDKKKLNFKQDIDVRGMRGDETLTAVSYFIDDAILVGVSRVRILHGTGNGILRRLIRDYLSTIPKVTSFRDEDIRFGGASITVVDLS